MKAFHPMNWLIVLTAAFALTSCGGGSGGLMAGGGIDGSGVISQGPISSYGSIVVNGTTFHTDNAEIMVDGVLVGVGDPAVSDFLEIGMVVIVEGSVSESDEDVQAERVAYNETLQGPVESLNVIDDTTTDLIVIGQVVRINALTRFKGTDFDSVAPDDVVSVSGFFDDQGDIWASFVERTGAVEPDTIYQVTGTVINLDTNLESFRINTLQVDYSEAVLSNLPTGGLAEGMFVEVEGTLEDGGGVLRATGIEPGDSLEVDEADEIEVIGFVTKTVSSFEFTVGNQVVRVNVDAEFVDGTSDDVIPGAKLEAEGRLEEGILLAHEVEFWEPDQIELEGVITAIDSSAEFTLGDQVIQTDADTVFENGSAEDLGLGVAVEVKGVPVDIDRSVVIADKISFEED